MKTDSCGWRVDRGKALTWMNQREREEIENGEEKGEKYEPVECDQW